MPIFLEINQDEAFNFFSEYDKLSELQKKIWQYLSWMAKTKPVAFPSQTKMAEKFECSRKHVNRTLSRFRQFGWLWLQSRGRKKSKILNIPSHILQMDLTKREYFKRVEVTSKVTHSLSRIQSKTGGETGDSFHELQIPFYLEKTKFSLEQRLKLSMVPENLYRNGIESVNYQRKKGIKIDDPCSYIVGAAIRMAKNNGVTLDWKRYYRTLKKKAA